MLPARSVSGDFLPPINVIGDGGLVRVSLSNGGSVLHALRVRRQIQAPSGTVRIEALKRLRNPDAYKLDV
jgi:hypothetical protein